MRALLLVLALLSTSAAAQNIRPNPGAGAFSGGTLTAPLVLDATNTLCSEALALSFSGDTNTGMQRLQADVFQFCVAGVRAGYLDAQSGTVGHGNTAFGHDAFVSIDINAVDGATHNAAFGAESCHALTKGDQNSCLGHRSGYSTTTGVQNTFVGQGAGYENTVAPANTVVGYHGSLNNVPSSGGNTVMGWSAGEGVLSSSTYEANSLFGYQSGFALTTGLGNVAMGYQAGVALNSGALNVLVGYKAGDSVTTGGANTLIGREAGWTLTTQSYNVIVGANAGDKLTDTENTFVGTLAGFSATTSTGNVLIGYGAGEAGTDLTTGDNNTIIGHNAEAGSAAAANRVIIGKGAIGTTDNEVILGNTAIVQTRTRGRDVVLAGTPSSVTTGTCTNETLNIGDDVSAEVEADCTAGQTLIVTFSAAWAAAPQCVCTPANAAAGAITALQFCVATTTVLTITSVGSMTDGRVNYRCTE